MKLLFTFLSLRFFDMRRERETHNFFLCWLFHLTPPRAAHFVDPNWSRRGETKNRLPSSRLESQLLLFFQIPQILSASGHDIIHVPGPISFLRFLLWHLWLSHPLRTRVNTCAQCVHLTNPCTKRKVLSLTKPKGKIYKTKSLGNYITERGGYIVRNRGLGFFLGGVMAYQLL